MEGENHSMEKGLLLVNKEERRGSSETTITPLLIFTTFIIVSASYSFGIAVCFFLSFSTYKGRISSPPPPSNYVDSIKEDGG